VQISDYALDHLVNMEGSIPYVYDDGDGTWPKRNISSFSAIGYPTIGVGHRIYPHEQSRFSAYLAGGSRLSDSEISELLRADIETRVAATIRPKILVEITQSMWDALITQGFNTGPNTTAIKNAIFHINMKRWPEAQAALAGGATTSKGKVLDGLVKRRAYEASLFMDDGIPGQPATSIPRWAWVSGISISALLLLWGAIRTRRAYVGWQDRRAKKRQAALPVRDDEPEAEEEALPPGQRRITIQPPRGFDGPR
jgi:GH24 family phage-related lysozyme (muramidase)